MKVHTNNFKNQIKNLGRELEVLITYGDITLNGEFINSVTPIFNGNILKSVMKQLEIDSTINIPLNTEINFKFGVKVNGEYEYLDFGNYIVFSYAKQEDTKSYSLTCYDKMLYSMKKNEKLDITYPINIRDYTNAVCTKLGLTFKNNNETFVNYDKLIEKELYFEQDYTYRDILNEIAQVTASTICINNNDELEIRYINETNDTIDEEFLKDINVKFGEKYGVINSIVLSRSAESDNVYLKDDESITANGLCEIKIIDNQIMNWNNRSDFLPEILEKLKTIEYYINDFSSTGICYYDLCDKYNIQVENKIYQCIMFNDEININKGLGENIYTEMPKETKTDYDKADKTDRKINQVYLITDKQGKKIEALISENIEQDKVINENYTKILQTINEFMLSVQNSGGSNLIKNSVMFALNDKNIPTEWEVSEDGNLIIDSSTESISNGGISGHVFTLLNKKVKQRVYVKSDNDTIPENKKTYYTFSTKIKKNTTGECYVKIYNTNEEYIIKLNIGQSSFYGIYELKELLPKDNYYDIEFYGSEDSDATFTDNMLNVGKYKSEWSQANGEIMNTQVNVTVNGVLVKSSVYRGDYTIMSPLEFAGYSNINGTITKVFTVNKDITIVKKLEAQDEIKMSPLKIVPITTGDIKGWGFVPCD